MWKKNYFNCKTKHKVNTRDVAEANILEPSYLNPTTNAYANFKNKNNQILPQ